MDCKAYLGAEKERLQTELKKLALKYGLTHQLTVEASQRLDLVINKLMVIS